MNGATIIFTMPSDDGTLGTWSAMTDSGGHCTVSFTGGASATQVTAADGNGLGTANSYTFVVRNSANNTSESYGLVMWADQNPLEPGQSTTLHGQLTETSTSAPVGGAYVSLSVASGDGSLGNWSATTDGSGSFATSFTGGYSPTQINASDGNGLGASNTYTFIAGNTDGTSGNYSVTLWGDQSMLQSGQTTSLHALVWDTVAGVAAAAETVNFSVVTGDGTLDTHAASADGDGYCTVEFTAGTLQTQVLAWHGSGAASSLCTISVPILHADDVISLGIWSSPTVLRPGQAAQVQATLWNSTANVPVMGGTVHFAVVSGSGTLDAASATTDVNGSCSVGFVGGSSHTQVLAWDEDSEAAAVFTISVETGSGQLALWASPNPVRAGQQAALYAQLGYAGSGPVSGAPVYFAVVSGDGTLETTTAVTDENGTCWVGFVGGSGPTEISVWDGMDGSASYTFEELPPSYYLYTWANPNPVVAGGTATVGARVHEMHTGVMISGAVVNFEIVSGDGALGSYSAVTGSYGECSVTLTGGQSPTQIHVWDGEGWGTSSEVTVGFALPPATLTLWSDHTVLAWGQSTMLHARLAEIASGAAVVGESVKFRLNRGGGLEYVSAITDAQGECAVSVTGWTYPTEVYATDESGRHASANLVIQSEWWNAYIWWWENGGAGGGGGGDGGGSGGGEGGGGEGDPPSETFNLSVWPGTAAPAEGEQTMIFAQLKDTAQNVWVSGAALQFEVLYGDGTLGATSATTDESGLCSVPFTGGYMPTGIRVSCVDHETAPRTFTFAVASSSEHAYDILMGAEPNFLSHGQQTQLHVQMLDLTLGGTPVVGMPLHFSIVYGEGTLHAVSAVTNEFGNCQVGFTQGEGYITVIKCIAGNGLGATGHYTFGDPTYYGDGGGGGGGGGDGGGDGGGGAAVGCGCPQSEGRCQCPPENDPTTCACEPPPAEGCPCDSQLCNCGQPGVLADMRCSPPPTTPGTPYTPECQIPPGDDIGCECGGPGCHRATCNCGGDHPENCPADDQNQTWEIKHEVKHKAKTDQSAGRKKLGLSEEVDLSTSDGSSANWSINGTYITSGSTLDWTATATATAPGQPVTIQGEVNGTTKSVTFTVVAPDDIVKSGSATKYLNQDHTPTLTHTKADIYVDVTPTDVSFYNVKFGEQSAAPTAPTGDFTSAPWSGLLADPRSIHPGTSGGLISWLAVSKTAGAPGDTYSDRVFMALGLAAGHHWPSGTFKWSIQWDYQATNGQLVHWKVFDQVFKFTPKSGGECELIIEKFGESVTNY